MRTKHLRKVCVVLSGFGLVCVGLAVLVWFCVVFCRSVLVSLRFCGSVKFWVGFNWSRCDCVFCVVLGWSRLVSLRLFGSVWFWAGLGWACCVCAVWLSCVILNILCWSRPGLAAFCLDLYSFGLVAASFAVFFVFVYFVLVSASFAALCLVLYGFVCAIGISLGSIASTFSTCKYMTSDFEVTFPPWNRSYRVVD
jgi:hypothetical protein